jgi:hypothetical protein
MVAGLTARCVPPRRSTRGAVSSREALYRTLQECAGLLYPTLPVFLSFKKYHRLPPSKVAGCTTGSARSGVPKNYTLGSGLLSLYHAAIFLYAALRYVLSSFLPPMKVSDEPYEEVNAEHAHEKRTPGRWALTLLRGCCHHLLAFERLATPRAARDLLGISLARLLIVEEHPSHLLGSGTRPRTRLTAVGLGFSSTLTS